MQFYCNDFLYKQRTFYSKIYCYDKNNELIKVYNDKMDLPFDAFYELFNIEKIKTSPELIFSYKKWDDKSVTITEVPKEIQNLIIPETLDNLPVKYINADNLENIRYLELPSSFEIYPQNTFEKSKKIRKIYMHDGIDVLNTSAFILKKELEEVHLSSKIKKIPEYSFFDCSKLKKINLENIEEIGYGAFVKCINLKECNFSNNLSSIGMQSFMFSGLEKIEIPSSVTTIGTQAFLKCDNLKQIINKSNIEITPFDSIDR